MIPKSLQPPRAIADPIPHAHRPSMSPASACNCYCLWEDHDSSSSSSSSSTAPSFVSTKAFLPPVQPAVSWNMGGGVLSCAHRGRRLHFVESEVWWEWQTCTRHANWIRSKGGLRNRSL
jgi:hypothetical protein